MKHWKQMNRKERAAYIDENAHLLGTMPDVAFAAKTGISQSVVCRARAARGIPVYRLSEDEKQDRIRMQKRARYVTAQDRRNILYQKLINQAFRPVCL